MMKTKKTQTRVRITKKKIPFFKSSRFFVILCISTLFLFLFSQRNVLCYYLGINRTNQDNSVRDFPIHKILEEHIEKSFGIDVSEYQNKIDWPKLKEIEGGYPIEFVFIRATVGNERADCQFKRNWRKAKEYNLIRGAYHYYRPNENSIEQAKNFIQQVQLQKGDFPPILDIEKLPKKQSIDSLKIGLKRWLQYVEKHYKVKPIIYSGENYYENILKDDFSDYPFWIANYSAFYKEIDDNWSFWQIAENGVVNGIPSKVDINIFNGTSIALKKMLVH